jgi:hypothetical protein
LRGRDALERVGAKVLGAILNGVSEGLDAGGAFAYFGYYGTAASTPTEVEVAASPVFSPSTPGRPGNDAAASDRQPAGYGPEARSPITPTAVVVTPDAGTSSAPATTAAPPTDTAPPTPEAPPTAAPPAHEAPPTPETPTPETPTLETPPTAGMPSPDDSAATPGARRARRSRSAPRQPRSA